MCVRTYVYCILSPTVCASSCVRYVRTWQPTHAQVLHRIHTYIQYIHYMNIRIQTSPFMLVQLIIRTCCTHCMNIRYVRTYIRMYVHILQLTYVVMCTRCSSDVEENEDGDITSFTITPLQPLFKGARTYKLGAPTEAVSPAHLVLVQGAATDSRLNHRNITS